jgi:hypothetical protein
MFDGMNLVQGINPEGLTAFALSWTANQRFNDNVLLTFGTVDGTDADLYYDGTDMVYDVNSGVHKFLGGGDGTAAKLAFTGTAQLLDANADSIVDIGTSGARFNPGSKPAHDFKVEALGLTAITVDSGLNTLGIGRSVSARGFLIAGASYTVNGGTTSGHMVNVTEGLTGESGVTVKLDGMLVNTNIITQTATESIADVSQLHVIEPGVTDNLTGDITRASTLFIEGIPTEGGVGGANDMGNFGVLIDGAGSDATYIALASSDVSHAFASAAQTDVFGILYKQGDTSGGLGIKGFTDAAGITINLQAVTRTANTTQTTGGLAAVLVQYQEHDGAGNSATPTANANIFGVRDAHNGVLKFLVDEDGDFLYDGADGGAFDSKHDAQVLRAFSIATSQSSQIIRSEFDEFLKYNEDDLVAMGVLGARIADGGLVNGAQLNRVLVGAAWQQEERLAMLESKLQIAETKLASIGA